MMLISGIQGFKNSFLFKSGEIMSEKLTEEVIVDKIIDFMLNKVDGNWHEEKVEKSDLHKHGVDIKLVGGKRNSEYFLLNAKENRMQNQLGQLIVRAGLMHKDK